MSIYEINDIYDLLNISRDQISYNNFAAWQLFRLPPEVRNRIYALVCDTIIITYEGTRLSDSRRLVKSGASLKHTCRQTYHEMGSMVDDYDTLHMKAGSPVGTLRYLTENVKCHRLKTLILDEGALRGAEYDHSHLDIADWGRDDGVSALFPNISSVVMLVRHPRRLGLPNSWRADVKLRTCFRNLKLSVRWNTIKRSSNGKGINVITQSGQPLWVLHHQPMT